MASESNREFFRHALATLAYRAGKVFRDVPESFSVFAAGEDGRTASQIVAHMGDLMDWALSMADGTNQWHDSPPLEWKQGVDRFFVSLKALDDYMASANPAHADLDRLFQAPVADALTHVGQLAMMRRLAGSKMKMKGENYFLADIEKGRVGPDQAAPKREF